MEREEAALRRRGEGSSALPPDLGETGPESLKSETLVRRPIGC